MEGTAVLLIVVGVWIASARFVYLWTYRSHFWRFPGIWIPQKAKRDALLFSLLGPCSLGSVLILDLHGYAPVPELAYLLDNEFPIYGKETSTYRWQVFSFFFQDRSRKGHSYEPRTLQDALTLMATISPLERQRKIMMKWN